MTIKFIPTFATNGLVVCANSDVKQYLFVKDEKNLYLYIVCPLEQAEHVYQGQGYKFFQNMGSLTQEEIRMNFIQEVFEAEEYLKDPNIPEKSEVVAV